MSEVINDAIDLLIEFAVFLCFLIPVLLLGIVCAGLFRVIVWVLA